MDTQFQISLHIKTPVGFQTYGTFELGRNREQAKQIFEQLQGTAAIAEHSVLYMDFYELRDGIPFPIEVRHCTLDEVAYNTRIITRDVFKNLNL